MIQLISDEELLEVEAEAYKVGGDNVYFLIGGLIERNRHSEALIHIKNLVAKGFTEVHDAMAEHMCDQFINGDEEKLNPEWVKLKTLYAQSERDDAGFGALELADSLLAVGDKEAIDWLKLAANKNNGTAAEMLGEHYLFGSHVEKNIAEGARLLMRSQGMRWFPEASSFITPGSLVDHDGWQDWEFAGILLSDMDDVADRHIFIDIISAPIENWWERADAKELFLAINRGDFEHPHPANAEEILMPALSAALRKYPENKKAGKEVVRMLAKHSIEDDFNEALEKASIDVNLEYLRISIAARICPRCGSHDERNLTSEGEFKCVDCGCDNNR